MVIIIYNLAENHHAKYNVGRVRYDCSLNAFTVNCRRYRLDYLSFYKRMIYLLSSVITLGSFLLGYWLGYGKIKAETPKEISELIEKAKGNYVKPGVIMRPTQKDLMDRKNPTIAEGKKEFKKLLDTLPIKIKNDL
jgi:hypothetical protein